LQHRPIKVLLVESDEGYIGELSDGLSRSRSTDLQIESVDELSQALARLSQGGFDAILLSLDLTDSRGMVTFDRAYAFAPDVRSSSSRESPTRRPRSRRCKVVPRTTW
jgi:DNA-binding NtrC family response regulator